jgi:MYXO-CTERM domain-containing protein
MLNRSKVREPQNQHDECLQRANSFRLATTNSHECGRELGTERSKCNLPFNRAKNGGRLPGIVKARTLGMMSVRLRGSVGQGLLLAAGAVGIIAAVSACEPAGSEGMGSVSGSIVGGKLDTLHRGVVSLLKQVDGGFFPSCSGTLLTQNLVLTAHHCVAGLNSPDGASVECGKTEFKATEKPTTMLVSVEANVGREGLEPFRVSQVWVPPGSSAVCGRDIALLLLSGSGVPANTATPIAPNLTTDLAADSLFKAIGYGLQSPSDETGETAGHRMIATDAQVFCQGSACGTDLVLQGEFIADAPVCSGDSGGPALDADGRVSGVTSRGDEKCTLGIYSSVAAWKDFIVEKTFEAAKSGHYNPPTWAGDPPDGFDPGIPMGGTGSGGSASSAAGTGALPLAGRPGQAGTGGLGVGGTGSGVSPVVDPLGLSCTGQCPGAYVCWAADNMPPGICVPQCNAQQTECPAEFSCDLELGACLRDADIPKAKLKQGGGCSVASVGGSPASTSGAWAALLLVGALWRGKRRKRQA